MRGLKPTDSMVTVAGNVAPCVGAWIETSGLGLDAQRDMSHPAWVRGLKLGGIGFNQKNMRRTLRGCVD